MAVAFIELKPPLFVSASSILEPEGPMRLFD
jgi:hypothetical protein